ncbi:MAG: Rrf2 family transcriptional regulator [Leptospiraceae bacterium]|nr:Rrf2 family transcriptional regulator [Leptospiraceae bacterium]
MVSKAFDYALRSMVYMAAHPEENYFGVKELSESIQVSKTYLGKILQDLVRHGYLKSVTGPGGGFGLQKEAKKITMKEVLEVVDGTRLEDNCILGQAECSDKNPCPIHETWKKQRKDLLTLFKKTTIEEASKKSWPQFKTTAKVKK